MKRILFTAVLSCCLIYGGDYFSLLFQIPNHRQQFGAVQVRRSYAVALRNNKVEYMFAEPATETCVYSLLPHLGDRPCWYVNRHQKEEIKLGTVNPQ